MFMLFCVILLPKFTMSRFCLKGFLSQVVRIGCPSGGPSLKVAYMAGLQVRYIKVPSLCSVANHTAFQL